MAPPISYERSAPMGESRTEGIVIRKIPYHEHDAIITVLTEKLGIISIYIKQSIKKTALSPFSLVDLVCTRSKGSLYLLQDFELLDPHLGLREDLDTLNTASRMAKALLAFQLEGPVDAGPFLLFRSYLKKTALFLSPTKSFDKFLFETFKGGRTLTFTAR